LKSLRVSMFSWPVKLKVTTNIYSLNPITSFYSPLIFPIDPSGSSFSNL
jgi:hypothetical protein